MSNLPAVRESVPGDATLHLVGFTVGREEFGVDILKVQEIIRMAPISIVPNAPEFLEGVINLRGRIIPIIDFRKRFHIFGTAEMDERSKRIVVLSLNGTTIGMVVDSVSQVIKLAESRISPTPSVAKGFDSEAIAGVGQLGDRLLIVLDLEQAFAEHDLAGMGGATAAHA